MTINYKLSKKDAGKVVLRWKVNIWNAYGRKAEKYKFNDLCCYLRKVERRGKWNHKKEIKGNN